MSNQRYLSTHLILLELILLLSLFPMECSSISWHDLMKKYWLPFHIIRYVSTKCIRLSIYENCLSYTSFLWSQLQGILFWTGLHELALTDKYIQVRFGLKMIQECWDREFFVIKTIFQKSNIDWSQQPPTEKMLKFNIILY